MSKVKRNDSELDSLVNDIAMRIKELGSEQHLTNISNELKEIIYTSENNNK